MVSLKVQFVAHPFNDLMPHGLQLLSISPRCALERVLYLYHFVRMLFGSDMDVAPHSFPLISVAIYLSDMSRLSYLLTLAPSFYLSLY